MKGEIKTFEFNKNLPDKLRSEPYGKNWPIVYILENGKEIYIGESISAFQRSKEHLERRKDQKNMHIIIDKEFNKSASLDTESFLIRHISGDGKMKVQNANGGIRDHNYYNKKAYSLKFEGIWNRLLEKDIVSNKLKDIENGDLFKYSPYKALTDTQYNFVEKLFKDIKKDGEGSYIVNGSAGTGKTILAVYLIKRLKDAAETKHLNVALVISMTSLRETLKKVFRNVSGLKSSMVIGPNDVIKEEYDVLVVDEAHRLRNGKNIGQAISNFRKVNNELGLSDESTQLDWIKKSAKKHILFYDENQNVMPGDVVNEDILKGIDKNNQYYLKEQIRVDAGDGYVDFINKFISDSQIKINTNFDNYDFRIIDNIENFERLIKEKDNKVGLSRIVAGYGWKWQSKNQKGACDIEIDGSKFKWNSIVSDWVNSKNAINEVGCIHTVQGYDLNYTGVIFGKEIIYNKVTKKIEIVKSEYYDRNGKSGVRDDEQLKKYVLNIYKTLLTRGIKGTYVYIVDNDLRDFLKSKLTLPFKHIKESVKSDLKTKGFGCIYLDDLESYKDIKEVENSKKPKIKIFAESNAGEALTIAQDNNLGYVFFNDKEWANYKNGEHIALKVKGNSMNKKEIDGKKIKDGRIVIVKKTNHATENDVVVSILNEASNIKEFHKEEDSVVLKSVSTEKIDDIVVTEKDDYMVIGIIVKVVR